MKLANNSSTEVITLEINGAQVLLFRKKLSFKLSNPINVLSQLDLFPKTYWHDLHTQKKILSFGAIQSFDALPQIKTLTPCDNPPQCFGGKKFFSKKKKK